MTQRDDMGREVGGGFRVGNSCTPVVDSCQCMAKPIQYCKVKKKKKKRMLNPYDQNGLISLGEIPQSRIAETKYKHLSSYLLIYISNLLF